MSFVINKSKSKMGVTISKIDGNYHTYMYMYTLEQNWLESGTINDVDVRQSCVFPP